MEWSDFESRVQRENKRPPSSTLHYTAMLTWALSKASRHSRPAAQFSCSVAIARPLFPRATTSQAMAENSSMVGPLLALDYILPRSNVFCLNSSLLPYVRTAVRWWLALDKPGRQPSAASVSLFVVVLILIAMHDIIIIGHLSSPNRAILTVTDFLAIYAENADQSAALKYCYHLSFLIFFWCPPSLVHPSPCLFYSPSQPRQLHLLSLGHPQR